MESTKHRPFALIAVAGTTILAGAVIGASTNAINGAVSPLYYRSILNWFFIHDIWRASIVQGILEGLLFGVAFSVVFTLVIGIVSRAQCPYLFALKRMLWIILAVYACWVTGGLIGMGLAWFSPEFFYRFIGTDLIHCPIKDVLRFAWVGGSIWGAELGALVSATIGSILTAVQWRNSQKA